MNFAWSFEILRIAKFRKNARHVIKCDDFFHFSVNCWSCAMSVTLPVMTFFCEWSILIREFCLNFEARNECLCDILRDTYLSCTALNHRMSCQEFIIGIKNHNFTMFNFTFLALSTSNSNKDTFFLHLRFLS